MLDYGEVVYGQHYSHEALLLTNHCDVELPLSLAVEQPQVRVLFRDMFSGSLGPNR